MGYPGRHNIYEATIRRMVNQELERQEQEFQQAHAQDTDHQLLGYLSICARNLGHSPWPGEIVGTELICQRFGTWEQALGLAGLPVPEGKPQPAKFPRVVGEIAHQKECYRRKKAQKKALAQERLRQSAQKKRTEDPD